MTSLRPQCFSVRTAIVAVALATASTAGAAQPPATAPAPTTPPAALTPHEQAIVREAEATVAAFNAADAAALGGMFL